VEPRRDLFAEPTDEELLARIQSGESDLFGTLVRRYERELYGYLHRYLGDADLAADVFQNTFLAVFRKIRHYEPGRAARPWLFTIAVNQAIDSLRRRSRRIDFRADPLLDDPSAEEGRSASELLAAPDPGPLLALEREEIRERVRTAVQALPEGQRQAVLLIYFQGLKYQEAAEIMGIPVGTVKSRLNAALVRLNEIWAKEIEPPVSILPPHE
jgi:RNA polymerase sigma-70 factor (ECF subfamily)